MGKTNPSSEDHSLSGQAFLLRAYWYPNDLEQVGFAVTQGLRERIIEFEDIFLTSQFSEKCYQPLLALGAHD